MKQGVFSNRENSMNDPFSIEQLPFPPDLLWPLDKFTLAVRTANCLANDNISHIFQAAGKSEPEMLRIPNFGRKSLNDMKELFASMGLHFGMDIWEHHANLHEWAIQAAASLRQEDAPARKRVLYKNLKNKEGLRRELSDIGIGGMEGEGIRYVADAIQKTPRELLLLKNFTYMHLRRLQEFVSSMELTLGVHVVGAPRGRSLSEALRGVPLSSGPTPKPKPVKTEPSVITISITDKILANELKRQYAAANEEFGAGPMPDGVKRRLLKRIQFARRVAAQVKKL
jgi:hypothetical protein